MLISKAAKPHAKVKTNDVIFHMNSRALDKKKRKFFTTRSKVCERSARYVSLTCRVLEHAYCCVKEHNPAIIVEVPF